MVVDKTNHLRKTEMEHLGVRVEEVQTPLTVQVQAAQAPLVKVITVELVPGGLVGQALAAVVPAQQEQIIPMSIKEVQVVSESLPQLQDRLCTMLAVVVAAAPVASRTASAAMAEAVTAQAKILAQGMLERLILAAEVAAAGMTRAVMADRVLLLYDTLTVL
jgi:hypothetical protein